MAISIRQTTNYVVNRSINVILLSESKNGIKMRFLLFAIWSSTILAISNSEWICYESNDTQAKPGTHGSSQAPSGTQASTIHTHITQITETNNYIDQAPRGGNPIVKAHLSNLTLDKNLKLLPPLIFYSLSCRNQS